MIVERLFEGKIKHYMSSIFGDWRHRQNINKVWQVNANFYLGGIDLNRASFFHIQT